MEHLFLTACFLLVAASLAAESLREDGDRPKGTIAFSSIGPRGWDLYVTEIETRRSRRLTEHASLDYNASFSPDGTQVAFVSERDGNMELYLVRVDGAALRRLTTEFALDDHPAWSPDGRRIAFSSTRRAQGAPAAAPGQAWNGVYVMDVDGSGARRLSPGTAADYSPAWSPKQDLIAFASGSGREGGTDLYVMRADGAERRLVLKDGGWPAFSPDGRSLYFHSRRRGKWGVWRVSLDGSGLERITPPDLEAYTPRLSSDGRRLVAAVQRGEWRQIEVIDLAAGSMTPVTGGTADCWNPSLSPDGRFVVYHQKSPAFSAPNVEPWGTPPGTDLKLLRIAGAFPAFSPDMRRLALTGGRSSETEFSQLDVMNLDGTGRKTLYGGPSRGLFGVSWAHTGDLIAFSEGGVFEDAAHRVEIATVRPDGAEYRRLTTDTGNNGFPSFSPDGRQLVFRSGRGGSKNLYVMNRDGTGVRRLTEGNWTDTMCHSSPTGEWIAFASDRDGEFDIWVVRPEGTGLRKLIGGGGRNNHPHFSPDGKWVVFTSQRAGYSAEAVSLPYQPQPYGDLFAVRLDGSGLTRLTHNGFEEGTPDWGPEAGFRKPGDNRS
jgi:Tol biopolymer transport system component